MHIQSITFEGLNPTPLCNIGAHTQTDKCPYHDHPQLHRHGYTPIYHFLFHKLRHKPIKLAELGILHNASMQMWNLYFPLATLHGFDKNHDLLSFCLQHGLPNTSYHDVDVKDLKSICEALQPHAPFDIIIDDTTHEFADQINVIRVAHQFLVPEGTLVIEDLHRCVPNGRYEDMFRAFALDQHYQSATFINANHEFDHTEGMDNSKLLVLVKK